VAKEVVIPYTPRPQFEAYHDRKERFSKIVAHRRFGKTVGCINDMVKAALTVDCAGRAATPPKFSYIAPTYTQAKDVVWGYLKYYSSPIPGIDIRESELSVEYPNGARVRLYGADNYDRLRGLYNDGVILDEPAQIDPRAWPEVILPTLSDYRGWATFIGTPKGRDWFYRIDRNEAGEELPDWFRLVLKASDTGIIPADELAALRANMSESQYAQEFGCSFEAAVIGAYYGKQMAKLAEEGKISGVPYDPAARVYTAWDLGYRDATAVWFVQVVGREIHVIDYYERMGSDIGVDVKAVLDKPYNYEKHIFPHDAWATQKQTGKTTIEFIEPLGIKTKDVERAPDHRVEDGITNTVAFLPRCWFDKTKCARGIEALTLYRAEYDDKRDVIKTKPLHDWTSHGADAFRYLAMTLDTKIVNTGFNRPLNYANMGYA
jgi:phage terminase large subunit